MISTHIRNPPLESNALVTAIMAAGIMRGKQGGRDWIPAPARELCAAGTLAAARPGFGPKGLLALGRTQRPGQLVIVSC